MVSITAVFLQHEWHCGCSLMTAAQIGSLCNVLSWTEHTRWFLIY